MSSSADKEYLSTIKELLESIDSLSEELKKEVEELIALETEMFDIDQRALSNFTLTPSEDGMELWLHISSLIGEDDSLEAETILDAVLKEGYHCKLDLNGIDDFLKSRKKDECQMLIGKGVPPVDGVDGRIEYLVEEPTDSYKKITEYDRIDHRSHLNFVHVDADQELILIHQHKPGKPGKDIFGKTLSARNGQPVEIKAGRNIQFLRETGVMYAQKSGILLKENNTLKIDEVFIVHGDLDMSVGNIDTKSRVMIEGNVLPGFDVRSSSDIHVMGSVEASNLTSHEGSIVIEGGILGKNQCTIRSKKGLSCKFAQQALISCEGFIQVEDSILFCSISCGHRLVVSGGKHGKIAGGNIRIHKQIDARTIGAPSEPLTSITMGFDFSYEGKLNLLDERKMDILKSISNIEEQSKLHEKEVASTPPESRDHIVAKKELLSFKKEILLLKIELNDLDKEIKEVEAAAITFNEAWIKVRDIVYTNTVIKMSRRSHRITEEIRNATIELSPRTGGVKINGVPV